MVEKPAVRHTYKYETTKVGPNPWSVGGRFLMKPYPPQKRPPDARVNVCVPDEVLMIPMDVLIEQVLD